MKKILMIPVLAVMLAACGEITDDQANNDSASVTYEQARLLAYDYLRLDGNQYSLELDDKEASALGISQETLAELYAEVDNSNREILDILTENPDVNLLLSDPQVGGGMLNESGVRTVKTRAETNVPEGDLLLPPHQVTMVENLYLPYPYNGFQFILEMKESTGDQYSFFVDLTDFGTGAHQLWGILGYWRGLLPAVPDSRGNIYFFSNSRYDWRAYYKAQTA